MTKSRKLFVAFILLAIGYAAALTLSGLTESVRHSMTAHHTSADGHGLMSTLSGFVGRGDSTTVAGQLVPEYEPALPNAEPSAGLVGLVSDQVAARPTWLAATPPPNPPTTFAEPPVSSATPLLSENYTATPATSAVVELVAPAPHPSARITNVIANASDPVSRDASPWDRWPKWQPGAATAPKGAVPATYQSLVPVKPQTLSPAFDRLEQPLDEATAVENGGARTHVVIDGDSLDKLAERYLDDAALADEIYRLNRDVLSSPDLLPIGIELRIPDGRMADSRRDLTHTRSVGTRESNVPAGMVPVEWTPRPFDSLPRAELLRPVSASQTD